MTGDRAEIVGVLGGTFDPVHLGHLHAAETVRRLFALPRAMLVPCAIPPHKSRPGLTTAEHRLAMLRLAVEGREGLEVSTIETDRGGVSYTIQTLRALRDAAPSKAPLLIVGWDALIEIETWFEHLALLREFDLVAVDRPPRAGHEAGGPLPREISEHFVPGPAADGQGTPPGDGGRIYRVTISPLPISSSEVRALAAAGSSLAGLVPLAVARYIQAHALYRQEGER